MSNNPDDDWMDNAEKPEIDENEKYERFYYKWKKRVAMGENPDTASSDAPEGFQKWLKSYKRGIK